MDLDALAKTIYKKETIHAREICPACARPLDKKSKVVSKYVSRTVCGPCFGNAVHKAGFGVGQESTIQKMGKLKFLLEGVTRGQSKKPY